MGRSLIFITVNDALKYPVVALPAAYFVVVVALLLPQVIFALLGGWRSKSYEIDYTRRQRHECEIPLRGFDSMKPPRIRVFPLLHLIIVAVVAAALWLQRSALQQREEIIRDFGNQPAIPVGILWLSRF